MKKSKVIEILWTLTLLTGVVVSCFYILLLGSKCYQTVIDNTNQAEDERLPVSFIATSIRQSNKDQVSVEEIDGVQCLIIHYEEYSRYIYVYDDELKEMVALPDTTFSLSSGETISRANELSFNLEDNILSYQIKIDEHDYNMKVVMR